MVGRTDIGRRRAAGLVAALALWGMSLAIARVPVVRADEFTEHEVKAAFLYNFAKFVEWPGAKLGATDERMSLCVVGENAFHGELVATVHEKTVRGKRLVVEQLQSGDDLRHCHILFVGQTDHLAPVAVLEEVRGAHVLTVGDVEDFAARGGMINFRMQGNQVRFEINAVAAEEEGLQISSQLLKLAVRLIGGKQPLQ